MKELECRWKRCYNKDEWVLFLEILWVTETYTEKLTSVVVLKVIVIKIILVAKIYLAHIVYQEIATCFLGIISFDSYII